MQITYESVQNMAGIRIVGLRRALGSQKLHDLVLALDMLAVRIGTFNSHTHLRQVL